MARGAKFLLVVAVGLGIITIVVRFRWDGWNVSGSALSVRSLATQGLGEYLAQHYRGKRVLVISNPFTQEKGHPAEVYAFESAGIRGLRSGLGKNLIIQGVVFPELRSEFRQNPQAVYVDPKTTTPLSYLVADGSFDALLKNYPETDIVISLIGLPVNLNRLECWVRSGRPSFALLLPDLHIVGNPAAVKQAMQSSKIVAAVLNKPRAPVETEARGEGFQAEFNKRFLVLTGENFDQQLTAYSGLLDSN